MVKIVSFDVEGDYAAFRDPGITTNQTVYVIPSKSAVIGILGAIMGLRRPLTLGPYGKGIIYGDDFIDLFKSTMIGIKVKGGIRKFSFFTNHRSLKDSKTKPFKTELLLNPKYTFYVKTNGNYLNEITSRIKENNFVYTPTLGHSYCPARINNYKEYEAELFITPKRLKISTVILDESSETTSKDSSLKNFILNEESPNSRITIIVERHLYHYFVNDNFERRVLRHWIPVLSGGDDSTILYEYFFKLNIVKFYSLNNGESICLY